MKPSSPFLTLARASAIAFAALFPATLFGQAQVQGSVSNGTTSRAVADQDVRLLMPRGGMQQVATATTDAAGHFAFSAAGIDPKSFYLVSTDFAGATYNAPAAFDSNGNANVNLTVYDSTRSPAGLRIRRRGCLLVPSLGPPARNCTFRKNTPFRIPPSPRAPTPRRTPPSVSTYRLTRAHPPSR